jgi:Cu/Ag efflux protein CusF
MKTKVSWIFAAVFVLSSAVLLADHEKEATIVKVNQDTKTIVVQDKKGEQSTLYCTASTKLKDGITWANMKPGDKIEFEYTQKDGKMWVNEIEKEH